jgi:uncharacterized protein YaiI (UPF0178 family)
LSSDKDLSRKEANLVYDILNKFNFITRLNDTFRRNISEVKRQWLSKKRNDSFHLISVKRGEVPMLESFSNFESAEKVYYEKYKKDSEAEIVLTYVKKPNFQQISIAYANYILSYHAFMKDIEPILEQLAIDALENNDYKKFKKIFTTYEEIQVSHILDIMTESKELFISRLEKQKLMISKDISLSRSQEKEILNKINKTYTKQRIQYSNFIEEINTKIPKSFIKKRLFNKFLKKHTKRIINSLKEQELIFRKVN